MTCLMACSECGYPPQVQCVRHNSSTAFPDAKLKDLVCPRGRDFRSNWVYVDRFVLNKHVSGRFVSKAVTRICYSQKLSEQGIMPNEFFIWQGRKQTPSNDFGFDCLSELKGHTDCTRESIDSDSLRTNDK